MSKKTKDVSEMEVVKGSGNVFADLGVPNAEEELAKADLALSIRLCIKSKYTSAE